MRYFVFWTLELAYRMDTFESAADMEAWFKQQPEAIEISTIIHGMEVDRAILCEVVK